MSSSRLSNLYKTIHCSEINNDNEIEANEIKVNDLQCVNINTDISPIKKLIKDSHKNFIIYFFTNLFLFILISSILYSTIKTSNTKFNKEIVFLCILFLFSFCTLLYLFKQICNTKNCLYKKAQYGVVRNKHISRNIHSISGEYYVDVLFLDTHTYIRNVICTDSIYDILEENSDVLVVSFNNRTAYAIPSKYNRIEINVNDLQCVYINDADIASIKKFTKTIHRDYIIEFFCFLIFFIPTSSCFFSYAFPITITPGGIIYSLSFLIFPLLLFFILLDTLKQIRNTKNFLYKKAQYGVVIGKHILKDTSSESYNKKKYYVTVLFPNLDTYIRQVICNESIYNMLDENSNVLVISFDNKTAYAFPLECK